MSSTHGRIPDSFIQTLLAKTDIVALVQEAVPNLKKAGSNYSACCPFHNEKTPSFTVSPMKQFYHCFGCGQSGDAIAFVQQIQGLSFIEAIEQLSARVGLIVPKEADDNKHQERVSTVEVLNRVQAFYAQQLKNHAQAKQAVAYLKRRGLTGIIAKQFGLGFALESWNALYTYFQQDPHALTILEQTGLIIKHAKGHYYDRFRNRIMFPIRNRKGDVIGFGARIIETGEPKYLNSPDSPIFHKGYCLYGIYEALQTRQKLQTAIVVEGYMDVVALAQHGVIGSMATLGTAITSHHLTALFQLVPEVVFCFDGDEAGNNAAFKALQLVLEHLTEGRQVRFVFLPQKEDPDSFVRRNGLNAFTDLVKKGMPLSDYFFACIAQQVTPDSVDNRAHFASLAKPLIEKIPNGIFREMMFEQLAKIVSSTPQVVRGEKAYRRFTYDKHQYKPKVKLPPPQVMSAVHMASAILLNQPELIETIKERVPFNLEIYTPGMELFHFVVNSLLGEQTVSLATLRDKIKTFADHQKVLDCEEKVNLLPKEALKEELLGALIRLEGLGREQYCEKLLEKAKRGELSEEEKVDLKKFLQSRESIQNTGL